MESRYFFSVSSFGIHASSPFVPFLLSSLLLSSFSFCFCSRCLLPSLAAAVSTTSSLDSLLEIHSQINWGIMDQERGQLLSQPLSPLTLLCARGERQAPSCTHIHSRRQTDGQRDGASGRGRERGHWQIAYEALVTEGEREEMKERGRERLRRSASMTQCGRRAG